MIEPVTADERLIARVSGRVQGVGFRWFVVNEAAALGVTGWVANEPDGSVQVVAEGPRAALEGLVDRLRIGPRSAIVADVAIRWEPPTGTFSSFGVRSRGHAGD